MFKFTEENILILESADVKYTNSKSLSGESHFNSWRKKYIGKNGIIYIIKRNNMRYFQWHPYDNEGMPIFNKGLVSSKDDYCFKDNKLYITSENSIYEFQVIKKLVNVVPPILW